MLSMKENYFARFSRLFHCFASNKCHSSNPSGSFFLSFPVSQDLNSLSEIKSNCISNGIVWKGNFFLLPSFSLFPSLIYAFIVPQPPTITKESAKNYIVDPRDNIFIECEAKGNPTPT